MTPSLGIIEGYYGEPWNWEARTDQVSFLKPFGYDFYMYAPKADGYLRRRWREPHPDWEAQSLKDLAAHCRRLDVRFGVGLSPFEIYRNFNAQAQADLAAKLAHLDQMGVQDLGILFDDMRGDLPSLADTQIRILHWIAERTNADRIVMCPTYYSDDPQLDGGFGVRPPRYLETLGQGLDPAIEMFWTGEEVCCREFSVAHLARVAEQMGRKPFLWDNYPVNDGPRMSPYLYIRAFTGRSAGIGDYVAAHAINPALQPVLSRVPAISLAESYELGDQYQYGAALGRAAVAALGPELGLQVQRHLSLLNDTGLDILGDAAPRLRDRYAKFDHLGAREIVDWLDGRWRMTRAMMAAAEPT